MGLPVKQRYAGNISTGLLNVEGDMVGLKMKARKSGWRIMEEECAPEEWAFWAAYDKACESGRRLKKPARDRLPKCIGAAAKPAQKEEFVFEAKDPSTEPAVDLSELEIDEQPAKKGKRGG